MFVGVEQSTFVGDGAEGRGRRPCWNREAVGVGAEGAVGVGAEVAFGDLEVLRQWALLVLEPRVLSVFKRGCCLFWLLEEYGRRCCSGLLVLEKWAVSAGAVSNVDVVA